MFEGNLTADWTILLRFGIAALALGLVQRQLHRHIQGLVLLLTANANLAALAHFMLLLPGVLLHEMSHWLAARMLGVRVGPISIGPERKRGAEIRFGSVQIARADPVRESLIGLAPFVTGTALVLLMARWGFGLLPSADLALSEWPARMLDCVRAPDAWVWVYLIFAVSNTMMPSASDRRPWGLFALYLALLLVAGYLLVGIPQGSEQVLHWGLRLLSYLAYAFTLTVVIDLAVLALLLLLEWITGGLTGRRLEFRS